MRAYCIGRNVHARARTHDYKLTFCRASRPIVVTRGASVRVRVRLWWMAFVCVCAFLWSAPSLAHTRHTDEDARVRAALTRALLHMAALSIRVRRRADSDIAH